MARATEQLKQAMEVCELGALTLPNQVDVLMDAARAILQEVSTLTPPNEPLSPYPDGDTSILACPCCGSGEYLHNEDGNEQNYCGQCGQTIDWSRPAEGEA